MERMQVPPAVEGSWDRLLHMYDSEEEKDALQRQSWPRRTTTNYDKLFIFSDKDGEGQDSGDGDKRSTIFDTQKGQWAIGAVYNPSYEKYSNYVETVLSERYDALVFIDKTSAPHLINVPSLLSADGELPESFPTVA